MRVLHVIPSVASQRGGPSQAVLEMVAALRKTGINAEIATTNDDGAGTLEVQLGTLQDYQGVPVRFFKRFSPKLNAVREFAFSYGFMRWLKNNINDYDLIHVHAIFSFCSSYAMWLARKQGKPYIVRPIGQLEDWAMQQKKTKKHGYLSLIERKNIESANTIQFTAESEQSQTLNAFPTVSSSSIVIPLGLNTSMQIRDASVKLRDHWQLNQTTPVIAYLSRLHPKKGLELLLKSLANLSNTPYQLLIAGDGEDSYKAELKQLISKLEIEQHCKFVGFMKSAEKNLLLQGADVFALTSYSENFGISVLEALAAGTPVIVSEGVALSKEVNDHKLGYVTDLSEESITAALTTSLNEIEITQEMGIKAKAYIEANYLWPTIASTLSQHYQALVKNSG